MFLNLSKRQRNKTKVKIEIILFDKMEKLMKTIKSIIILTMVTIFTTTTYAAEVPRESAPCAIPQMTVLSWQKAL